MTSTTLKGKVSTRFPARVTGVDPIVVTKTNGDYVITYRPPTEPTTFNNFVSLEDTPHAYAGQAGKQVVVKGDESGLEFIASMAASSGGPFVYVADFGAVGNGSTDDTAAINAAFASLLGTSGTVVFGPGVYKITSTIIVGQKTGSGVTSHINILCTGSQAVAWLKWMGPTTGAGAVAIAFCKNKYFNVKGLAVFNAVAKGDTIGIMLAGDTATFGNAVNNGLFQSCLAQNFHIGIQAGGFTGAASEIAFNSLQLQDNDIGFTAVDFNSLDFTFTMVSLSGNGVGIDTGVASGFTVFGGSASNSATADFTIGNNSSQTYIGGGFRSETTVCCVLGQGGSVVIDRILTVNSLPANTGKSISGNFSTLIVRDCVLEGSIAPDSLDGARLLTVTGCSLFRWDTARKLPIIFPAATASQYMTHAYFCNNRDNGFPTKAIIDFQGLLGMNNNIPFYEPAISFFPYDLSRSEYTGNGVLTTFAITFAFAVASDIFVTFGSAPPVRKLSPADYSVVGTNVVFVVAPPNGAAITISRLDFGFDYVALNHVRQLAEGTIGSASAGTAPVTGKNLRVQGTLVAGTLAFKFKRALTTSGSGGPVLTATVGTFKLSDVGKPVFIALGADTGADWYGYITDYLTSTTVNVFAGGNSPGGRYPQGAGKACTVGEDEPDTNYMVAGIVGNVVPTPETFSVTAIAADGFTITSSNVASTATVTALIVR